MSKYIRFIVQSSEILYETGELKIIIYYEDGKPKGVANAFDKSGKVIEEKEY